VAPLRVDGNHPHDHLVAGLHHIFYALDAIAGHELRDVDHPAKAQEVDEGAVRRDADDLAERNGPDPRQWPLRAGRQRQVLGGEGVRPAAAEFVPRAAQGIRVRDPAAGGIFARFGRAAVHTSELRTDSTRSAPRRGDQEY
jgi:hypothetical protein